MYDILLLTNSTLLIADMVLLYKKKKKAYTQSKLYFDSSFDTDTSEPALYKLLTFQVPYLIFWLPTN
jgi:hypothetical protein